MKTINKKTKTTSILIATILFTGMIGSMGQSAHAVIATADFESPLSIDDDVEGLDAAVIGLNIQSPDSRAIVIDVGGSQFSSGEDAYDSTQGKNGCLDGQGMKVGPVGWSTDSDITQKSTVDFTFDGKTVSFFNITAYDYGDFNPSSDATSGLVLTAYNGTGSVIAIDTYSVPSASGLSSYDACESNGIETLSVTANGIAKVELRPIGVGDPGVAFDNIKFESEFTTVDVAKFYDVNHNGEYDDGEEFLDGWLVNVNDTAFEYEYTNATYVLELDQNFTATEFLPNNYTWINTTTTSIEFNSTDIDEIWFSNVCVGEIGSEYNPHTKGFWSNKNGQKLCDDYDDSPDYIKGNLTQFTFTNNTGGIVGDIDECDDVKHEKSPQNKKFLKNPTLGNANYTLSQQLLAMVLNNATESVDTSNEVYCHTIGEYFVLDELMLAANSTLAGENHEFDPSDLADCLDDANNNMNFVQEEVCEFAFPSDVQAEKTVTDIFGSEIFFEVNVTNNGPFPAVNVNVTDSWDGLNTPFLDSFNDGCQDTDNGLNWAWCLIGDIVYGNEISKDIDFLQSGDSVNNATVTSDGEDFQYDGNLINNNATVPVPEND
jgi:uncharacterized repeat protein (TIGR01451 family)